MASLSPLAGHWDLVNGLLDEALDLPPAARPAWLDALSGERAAQRESLRRLLDLQAEIETDDFLVAPPTLGLVDEPAHGPAAGAVVGAYRLIGQIGQGGMGTVWLAERSDGLIDRRVALKLPRAVWGDAFAERLARERALLATLEHEHIARLYDAGVDAQGRPFFAMEYVDGTTLDAWCAARRPSVRERVALLLQVMDAVSHAHSRLIVHRDLKPGNVLVTGAARVKLLDFGIAKLLAGETTGRSVLTQLNGRALSPDYASPEQIRGEPLGTASDIYSMAVVAYEVLAGSRPYRLKRASVAELERAIAEVEPPLASDAARGLPGAGELRGDLDAILNKALKKAPAARYSTMQAFAQDLQRFLDGAPVEARPDRWRYRAGKFVQRHRLQVGAGAVVAVALVAGTSVALWQAREARRSAEQARVEATRAKVEAATAKAVQDFIESVFGANTKYQADPRAAGATTARELLDRGADRIATALASAPEAQLRLYGLLAEMYGGMWQHERAQALYRRALELATRLHGPSSDAALGAAAAVGHTLDDLGRRDEALAILLEADAAASRRGAADTDTVRVQIDAELARLYIRTDLAKALVHARRAAALSRAQGASPDGINALQILGEVASAAERLDEARDALVEAVAWTERQDAQGIQSIVLGELGKVQDALGEVEAASVTLGRAVALAERFGDSGAYHEARLKLARFQVRRGLLREFLQTTGPEVEWARAQRSHAESRHLPALVMANYGRALVAYGDAARGLAAIEEALALLPPESTPALRGQFIGARANALVSLNRLTEAGTEIERAAAMTSGRGERVVEELRAIRRRQQVAVGQADDALRDFAAHPPKAAAPETKVEPYARLPRQIEEATLLLAAGRTREAHAAAAAVLESIDRLPDRRFAGDAPARLTAVLGEALLREGRVDEALPVLRRALASSLDAYDPQRSPDVARVRAVLAQAERRRLQ